MSKLEDDFSDVVIQWAKEDFQKVWENRTKTVDMEQDKKLKGKYKRLFKRIEHGNRKHRNWLYDEMLKFQQEEGLTKEPETIRSCPNMTWEDMDSIIEGWNKIDKLKEEYLRESQEEGTHLCPLPNMGSFEIVGIWLTDKLR